MIDPELSFLKWKKVFFYFFSQKAALSLARSTLLLQWQNSHGALSHLTILTFEHKRQASKNHDVKDQSIEKNVCEKMKKEREGGGGEGVYRSRPTYMLLFAGREVENQP